MIRALHVVKEPSESSVEQKLRLMNAAEDLLEALKGVIAAGADNFIGEEMRCYCGDMGPEFETLDCWVCVAKRAISKATGGAQ